MATRISGVGLKRHKILYINPFSQAISGPDQSLVSLLRHLDQQVYQPMVWLPQASPFSETYAQLGATLLYAPVPALQRNLSPLFWLRFCRDSHRAKSYLADWCAKHDIALVHNNMESVIFPLQVRHRLGRPLLQHVRGTSFYRPQWLGRRLTQAISKNAEGVVCISRAVQALFAETERVNVEVLYNPVEINPAELTPQAANLLIQAKKKYPWLVGIAGRLNPRKNLETFLQSAARIVRQRNDVGFVIVGGTANSSERAYQQRLLALADSLGIASRCFWTGEQRGVAAAFAYLNIACLTSHSEGFGRSLAEAAMLGLPLVGSNVGGIAEIIVDKETGLLVAANQPEDLAQAILQLLANPEKMRRMGEAAKKRSEMLFSAQAHARKISEVYAQLLTKHATNLKGTK